MNNAEKFEEVFGFRPNTDRPPCMMLEVDAKDYICKDNSSCMKCPFGFSWWEREYLPCFKLSIPGEE